MTQQNNSQLPANTHFSYGYAIVIAGLAIFMTTMGLNYTFGIFFKPLIAEFGWSRAVTSAAYSIMTMMSGFLGMVAGRLSDKFGPRVVCTVSGVFLGSGFILMSQVSSIWHVYLVYGFIVAAGIGVCWPVLMPLVPRWFIVRKGLMSGILSSGVGLGTLVFPPIASLLIGAIDWRSSYIIFGATALVLIPLAARFLKRAPRNMEQRPIEVDELKLEIVNPKGAGLDFRQAIRTKQFIFMCIIYFCFGFCYHSVMVHIVPHAMELGITTIIAASIVSMIGGLSIVCKVIMGYAGDKLGIKSSLIFSFILLFLCFLWLQFARELWMFYLFTAIFALAYGGAMSLQALMLGELFGLLSSGIIMGTVTFVYTIGGATGAFVAGYIFDITNHYNIAFVFNAILAITAAILTILLRHTSKGALV